MQSESSEEGRLGFIEAVTGLFHLQMTILTLLIRAHTGIENSGSSMKDWMQSIGRKFTMFDWTKEMIIDFNRCHDFFRTLSEGYLLAAVGMELNVKSWVELCNAARTENWRDALGKVLKKYGDAEDLVSNLRSKEENERDLVYENAVLFLQHATVYETFVQSMRKGNMDLVEFSIKTFTIWLHNVEKPTSFPRYRREMLRLMGCLKHVWSKEFREYYLDNCIVNFDGKEEGFMAADQACEHWIRELKEDAPSGGDPSKLAYYREILAPQASHIRNIRTKIYEATGIISHYSHSSRVDKSADVRKVTEVLLQEGAFEFKKGRKKNRKGKVMVGSSIDVHDLGAIQLLKGTAVVDLKKRTRGDIASSPEDSLQTDEITACMREEGANLDSESNE